MRGEEGRGQKQRLFYGDLLGLLALFIAITFYREEIPNARALILAAVAGMLGSIGLLVLYFSMTRGQMSIAAPVSALFAAALPVVVGRFTP